MVRAVQWNKTLKSSTCYTLLGVSRAVITSRLKAIEVKRRESSPIVIEILPVVGSQNAKMPLNKVDDVGSYAK